MIGFCVVCGERIRVQIFKGGLLVLREPPTATARSRTVTTQQKEGLMSEPNYFVVTKEVEIDMGHRVPNHKSKCRNPHGHRYRIVATVRGLLHDSSGASDEGMVMDFGDIKEALREYVHDVYDHGFMVYAGDTVLLRHLKPLAETELWNVRVVEFIPTAENLARFWYNNLKQAVPNLWQLTVWETPTSSATYPQR